ncbi:MAG: phenylalanine--tRNA ligase subunit alpha [Candidatus Margulisiibacteriota bacterium]
MEKISNIENKALTELSSVPDAKSAEALKFKYLGRKGEIASLFADIGNLPPEEKKEFGAALNKLKVKIEAALAEKLSQMGRGPGKKSAGQLDVTIPGKGIKRGRENIITQVMNEMTEIFLSLGYLMEEGPEVETDYYNFEALNIPANHPSKDMWSTFYLSKDHLLRTHTSPVQIRFMEKNKPPFAAIFPGKVFRRDAADVTHLPVFHQIEGLVVGEGITMSDLKGTLSSFLKRMFGKDRKVRFRPSYFPFTEPSAEVDVECFICEGTGCRICKNTGWLEILGSGMVHPNVFKSVKYDPEKISGFAFGAGIERIAMLKYEIEDIRLFFENDIRFLREF